MTDLKKRMTQLENDITELCKKLKRRPEEILKLIVTKKAPIQDIEELYRLGYYNFGENYIQNLLFKQKSLQQFSMIKWHVIGKLQSNKIKYLKNDFITMLHSLDSVSLALKLSSFFFKDKERQTPLLVLIQIKLNHSSEDKTGTDFHEAKKIIEIISQNPKLQFRGFMAIGPKSDKRTLDLLYKDFIKNASSIVSAENVKNPIISLGMTRDYPSAIQAGSTCIRVGSRIFDLEVR